MNTSKSKERWCSKLQNRSQWDKYVASWAVRVDLNTDDSQLHMSHMLVCLTRLPLLSYDTTAAITGLSGRAWTSLWSNWSNLKLLIFVTKIFSAIYRVCVDSVPHLKFGLLQREALFRWYHSLSRSTKQSAE